MKRMMKKISALCAGVVLLVTLTACSKFDASGYVKAILDNSYYNDSTAIVELNIGTAEEAAAIYEQGIEAQVATVNIVTEISDTLTAEYRQFFKDLYASVKYTVGEAVEVDKETLEVNVTYEKMYVFTDAVAAYQSKINEMAVVWKEAALAGEEVPTDAEMNEQLFVVLKDCLVTELAEASYEAPATATIRVQLVNNVWTPNQEDLLALEYALFDFEGLYEMQ